MTEKIYIVFQKWESKHGDRDAQILTVTFDKEEAIKCLREERDEILANNSLSVDEIKNNNNYDIEDTSEHFYLFNFYGGWDEITIMERDIKMKNSKH